MEFEIESTKGFISNNPASPEHREEVETEAKEDICDIKGAVETSTRYVCCDCHCQSEAEDENQNQTESSDDIASQMSTLE